MTLAPYQGMNLVPGVGTEVFSAEHDVSDIVYGPLTNCLYLTNCLISGASRDAGNTGNTTVLRPGLVMGIITASGKWAQFTSGAVDGTQYARGILLHMGLNTQLGGADADRWVATILVRGVVNPSGICLASTAGYGLARASVGLEVRKHLMYAIQMSDDFMNDLTIPLSGR